jgi:4-coumarate--CoA ligase
MSKSESAKDSKADAVKYAMCSGANLRQGVTEYLQKRFRNAPIFQGYGMMETNIATLRPSQAGKVGRQYWQAIRQHGSLACR